MFVSVVHLLWSKRPAEVAEFQFPHLKCGYCYSSSQFSFNNQPCLQVFRTCLQTRVQGSNEVTGSTFTSVGMKYLVKGEANVAAMMLGSLT